MRFLVEEEPMDFARLGEEPRFWFGTLALDGLTLLDGDLAPRGKPLDALKHTAIETFHLRVRHRQRAASWLVGLHPLMSQSPDTT
jgi:hypothetical protein